MDMIQAAQSKVAKVGAAAAAEGVASPGLTFEEASSANPARRTVIGKMPRETFLEDKAALIDEVLA